jgi:glycosyltransferase involved in cell wall biosynthesis
MTTVLHLSSSSGPGGAETVVASLAAGLDRSRFRSVVCLFRDGWLRERCEGLGLETHIIPIHGMLDLRWLRAFCGLLRERGVGLIHAHEFGANTYGTLAGCLSRIPVIATVHGRHYYADSVRRRLAYRLVSRAAVMVAVSQDLRRFIIDATGVSAARVAVVHNGIAPAASVPAKARARLRHELGLVDGQQIVTMVGSLYAIKGHRFLVEAAPRILQSCPSAVFLIAGRGDCDAELRDQARRLGIGGRVRLLGLREDIPVLLAISDLFVQPSLSEGLSIAILEAMRAGCPVVTTRVGGNSELVIDGETGLLVPPRDVEQLAAAVIDLLIDPARARRLGDKGLAFVADRFGLQAMVDGYEAIYEALRQRTPLPSASATVSGGVR